MSQADRPSSTPALSVDDVQKIEGELRIRDTTLAERLGFQQPRMIRKLIKRYSKALQEIGALHIIEGRDPENRSTLERFSRRGPVGRAYWLTDEQALFITTKSNTDRASEITVQIVKVFKAVQSGLALRLPPGEEHRRTALPKPSLDGVGCVVLDVPVWFDTAAVPKPGEMALVVLHSGEISVETVAETLGERKPGMIGVVSRDKSTPHYRVTDIVPLIGAALEKRPRRPRPRSKPASSVTALALPRPGGSSGGAKSMLRLVPLAA